MWGKKATVVSRVIAYREPVGLLVPLSASRLQPVQNNNDCRAAKDFGS